MIARWPVLVSTVLLARSSLVLPGCDIKYTGQEMLFRYNPGEDSMDFLLIYRGLTAPADSPEAVGKALAIVERALLGRRHFALGRIGTFDLDDPETCKELDGEARAVVDSISLEEVGGFLDSKGRLSGYQRLRFRSFTATMAWLNHFLSAAVLSSLADGSFDKDSTYFDERSRELWSERARSGLPWIRFEGGAFELDLPATAETAGRLQSGLIDALADPESSDSAAWLGSLLAHLRQFEVEVERVVIRIEPPASGIFKWAFPEREVEYKTGLLEALVEEELDFASGPSLEEVRKLIER